jgi:prepilin peptidase CpaA
MTDFLISCALVCVLLWGIVSEVFYHRIGNFLVGSLLVGWIVMALLSFCSLVTYEPMSQSELLRDLAFSIAGAVCALLVGVGLLLLGQVGAGDIKLMSVLCLWVGFDNQLIFLMITALAGGILVLFAPLISYIESKGATFFTRMSTQYSRFNMANPLGFSHDDVRVVPYSVALSVGAFYFLWPRLVYVF